MGNMELTATAVGVLHVVPHSGHQGFERILVDLRKIWKGDWHEVNAVL